MRAHPRAFGDTGASLTKHFRDSFGFVPGIQPDTPRPTAGRPWSRDTRRIYEPADSSDRAGGDVHTAGGLAVSTLSDVPRSLSVLAVSTLNGVSRPLSESPQVVCEGRLVGRHLEHRELRFDLIGEKVEAPLPCRRARRGARTGIVPHEGRLVQTAM